MQTTDSWTDPQQSIRIVDSVTNLGITAKFGYDNTLIAVSTLDKAEPVSGAAIEIRNRANTISGPVTTDADGKVIAPSWVQLGI